MRRVCLIVLFFFNDTAATEIYTLSLHDALPISRRGGKHRSLRRPTCRRARPTARPRAAARRRPGQRQRMRSRVPPDGRQEDRKSTRLNSSHANISYAVFCLKKKQNYQYVTPTLL